VGIKIIFVTSEIADFVKAGGLGDAAASLPRALRRRGLDVRVLIPAYPALVRE
jgi:starch synthase